MVKPLPITVRSSKYRPERRFIPRSQKRYTEERSGKPSRMRVEVKMLLPRGDPAQGHRRQYELVDPGYVIDLMGPAAVAYVRRRLRELMKDLDGTIIEVIGTEEGEEGVAE